MKKINKYLKYKKTSAFTLIEMVIVLFIIGILMLLILPNLNAQKQKAENKTDAALVTTIQTQIDLYEDDIEKPVTLEKLKNAGAINDKQVKQAKKANITIDNQGKVSLNK
ncbi:MAG: competence type IV pilus major pilin ComGC [Lactobacillaceae bacterium]